MDNEISIQHKQDVQIVYWAGGLILILFLIVISPHALSQIISLGLLSAISLVLYNKQHHKLLFGYFFLSIVISKLLVYDFLRVNGTTFIGGGDDQVFTDMALYFTDHELDLSDPFYTAVPYKLYVFILTEWINLVRFFSGEPNNQHFHSVLLMLNSFYGATIAVNVKRIMIHAGIMDKIKSYTYALTLFNPFLLYYSSVLLREIFMVLLIVTTIYALLSDMKLIGKVLIIFLCFLGAVFVRPVNSVIILIASFIYMMQSIRSVKVRVFIIGTIAAFILFYIVPNIGKLLGRDVSPESFNKFSELTLSQASESSIGAKLVQSSNPLIQAILPLYVLLSPIPPPFVSDLSLKAFLISLGVVSWIFSLVLYFPFIQTFYKERKEIAVNQIHYYRFVLISSIVAGINVLIVGFSSHDPRHNLFIYPLLIPMALTNIRKEYFTKYKMYFFLLLTMLVSFLLFYVIYKLTAD